MPPVMHKAPKRFPLRYLALGALRYARSCAKNVVKIAIGRKPWFTPRDRLFRHCLRHALGGAPIRKLTCIGFTTEGGGSQILTMMRAIAFARAFGLDYAHTPLHSVEHGGSLPMGEWAAGWEAQFNLGAGEARAEAGDREVVDFSYNMEDLDALYGVDDRAQLLAAIVPELRRKYYLDKPRRDNTVTTIAVHVRRGEVEPDWDAMYTGNAFIAATLAHVRGALDARGVAHRTCIFTQGDYAGVAALDGPGTEIHRDGDALWAQREAIEADILVLAKSSFSYVAGLVCDGVVIYEPCGYPPLAHWVVRGPGDAFDAAALGRELARTLAPRG